MEAIGTNNQRIPRARGITFLGAKYNHTKDEADYKALVKYAVNNYSLSGFSYLGKPMAMHDFSLMLNIPKSEITCVMTDQADNIGFLTKENSKDMLSMIASLSMEWSMQDRARIQAQFDRLNKAQGEGYAPFISAEVNKTLKLMMEANQQIGQTFRNFFTAQNNTTNILNIIGEPEEKNDQEFLGVHQALQMLDEAGKNNPKALSTNPEDRLEAADTLALEYKLDEEDEVSARIVSDESHLSDASNMIDYNEEEHHKDIAHRRLKEGKSGKQLPPIIPA